MRNITTSIFALAVAAMAFASCQDNLEVSQGSEKNVQFFAQSIQTKTAFGTPNGTTHPTLWTSNDTNVKVSLNGDTSPKNAAVTPSVDYTTASFNANLTDDESGSYVFRVLSPASAALGYSARGWNIEIPTSQTPSSSSVDESAQVIVAKSAVLNAWPVSPVDLNFTHFTAYGKITIENLEGGATISGVSLTAESNWAGRYYYNDGDVSENSASKTISISTTSASDIWFACAPVDLSNKSLKITVTTDNGDYVKNINFPSGKGNFQAGKIAKFSVDFNGITAGDAVVYTLVKNLNDITLDSEIIIVSEPNAETGAAKALGTTQNGNNRSAADVAVSSETVTNPGDNVQRLTIKAGSASETLSLYTGSHYLRTVSGNNYLRSQTENDANSSFTVSLANTGVIELTANERTIKYNSNNNIFAAYGSGQTSVYMYKKNGTGTATPAIVVLPSLTAPEIDAEGDDDNKTVYVTWDDVANATSYLVECGSQQQTVAAGVEEYEFTVASYGDYDVYVTAQADGYKSAKSEKVTVKLTDPDAGGDVYTLCTSTSDLVAGGTYIIASGTSGEVQCISNVSNNNNRKQVQVSVVNSQIILNGESTVMTLQLGGSEGAWTLQTLNYQGTDGYLASAASGNYNYCRVISDSTTGTITFSNGAAVITLQPHASRNILRYNSNASCFACYSTGQAAVYLYKKN